MFRKNKQMGLYALVSRDEYIPLEDTVTINGQLCVHNDTRERYSRSKHSHKYSLYNQESYNYKEYSDNDDHISPFKNHTIIHELCIVDEHYSSKDPIAKINLNSGAAVILSTNACPTRLANLQLLLSSWTTEFMNEQLYKKLLSDLTARI